MDERKGNRYGKPEPRQGAVSDRKQIWNWWPKQSAQGKVRSL